jgi:hypothetical protein
VTGGFEALLLQCVFPGQRLAVYGVTHNPLVMQIQHCHGLSGPSIKGAEMPESTESPKIGLVGCTKSKLGHAAPAALGTAESLHGAAAAYTFLSSPSSARADR